MRASSARDVDASASARTSPVRRRRSGRPCRRRRRRGSVDPALGADRPPDRDRPPEVDRHPGRDAPVVVGDERPGHDLVEDRAHDPAVGDPVPALEPLGRASSSVQRPPLVDVERRGAGRASLSSRRRSSCAARTRSARRLGAAADARPQTSRLLDLPGLGLDEVLARRDLLAHEHREDLVGRRRRPRPSTRSSVRVSGFIVVSQSWSAFISPRPLKRWTERFLTFISLTIRVALLLGLGVARDLAGADAVERRLGDVEVARAR